MPKSNIDKGVDGEKYRRRSVPVSGGQWKPRTKNLREEHSVAAIRTRESVSKCDEL